MDTAFGADIPLHVTVSKLSNEMDDDIYPGSMRSAQPQTLSAANLAMQFESLGGSGHGCEFGLFQRHFGSEPLGLLRWADLSPDLLIQALGSRFDGVGLPENTIVFNPDHSDEWWTRDTRYWMAMRSFVKVADVSLERMTVQACRRLQFLRRKLIEDLDAGDKILVYKNMFRNLTDAEIDQLQSAVKSYGRSTLFYVRYADADHPVGMVETRRPGLIIGYIKHFAFSPENKLIKPVNDAWLALCAKAYAMDKGPRAEQNAALELFTGPCFVKPARARRIVLVGNCQMQAMASLYCRFVAGRNGDVLEHVASHEDLTPEGRAAIEQADVIVEQLFDLKQSVDLASISTSAPRVFIPMVTASFLWPFAGQPHPKNKESRFLPGGPYGGEAADSYLNRLILSGIAPEEAVQAYTHLDINSRVKLDRLYELVIDRQRARDKIGGYRIAEVIEKHFRTEQVFLSPYHPNVRVAVALASEFFGKLGAERQDIERMHYCTRHTPFPKSELPLHPAVCRHFGLDFVAPDQRYRFMNEGMFSFREYALRYMRYEWNEALEEGIDLVQDGNYDAARPCLMSGLKRSPNSAAGHNALGHLLEQQGQRDEAIVATQRAVELEPDVASYHAHLGNLLRQAGQFEAAETELRIAIRGDPTEPHYYTLLAHLRRHQGRLQEGSELIRQAIEFDPYSVELWYQQADLLETQERWDDLLAVLRRIVALAPQDAAGYQRLACVFERQNFLEDAVDTIRQAIKLAPNVGRYRKLLSDFLLRQGRPDEAVIEAYAAAINEADNANAYSHLGYVLRQVDDSAAAEAAFRHAIQLEPRNAHFYSELSVLLSQFQRYDEAMAAAIEATELAPHDPHLFEHLANLYACQNDLLKAVAAQQQAVSLQPEAMMSRVVLSDLFARQGDLVQALREAQKAVEYHPESAHALGHLAHVIGIMGKLEQAECTLLQALEIEPGNDHLRRQLAHLRNRKADADSA